jgi:multidrug efflux pump subunit AcrB
MKIVDLSISLRTSALVLTALICLGGTAAYMSLPKESNPSIEIPNIIVTTIYPGATPTDIENLVTRPIEQEIQGISGIKELRSTSTEGVSSVVIEFSPDVSITDANSKVREKIDLARADLPKDVEEPIISEIDLSDFPVMTVNLAADYPLSQLKRVAEDLQDSLELIPSVLEVDLIGGREREVQVNVNLHQLQAYDLGLKAIVDTVRDENTNLPGGSIDVDHMNYLLRVDGQYERPAEIADLVIKAAGGRPIFVRDVATVSFGFKKRQNYARLRVLQRDVDGVLTPSDELGYKQVISLNVKKRSGENILETATAVERVLADFKPPDGTSVLITGDQSIQVRDLVKDLENNIISGLVFVVAVLLFFLGVRTSLLVGVAIPLSMMVTFLVFSVMGQTLNFIILFSLIIALGMLVDNAIVIVENIYRFLEEGMSPFEAARQGTGEVGLAVLASTATTVAAFAPMLFWPGMIGEFMSYMPLTLIITLTSSLFVALVINPVLTGYFARVEGRAYPPLRRASKIVLAAALALALTVIGIRNQNVAIVLGGGTLGLVVLHLLVMRHIANWSIHIGLPWLVQTYRSFVTWMLLRDYTARWAYVRNMTALVSFTAAFGLAILAGVVFAAAGLDAAKVVLLPAGLLGAIGAIGVVLHTLEAMLLGGKYSLAAGLALGASAFGGLSLMKANGLQLEQQAQLALAALPVLLIALGLLGWPLRRLTTRLILTDNRAQLLNATLGGLFIIIAIFVLAPTGSAFFPDTDPRQIQVNVSGPIGANLEEGNRLARVVSQRIDALLADNPTNRKNIKNLVANVGVGGDAMFGGGANSPEESVLTLNLVDFKDRAESSQLTLIKLRDQLAGVPGADIEFKKDQQGPPTGPPVNIEIAGAEFSEVTRIAQAVKLRLAELAKGKTLANGMTDIRDNLNSGRPEMEIVIDRDRAAQFGLNTQKIAGAIRTAIKGTAATKWRTGEDEYDITVRLRAEDRADLQAVRALNIMHEGTQIPLAAIATTKLGSGLGSITRKDGLRVATVMANAKEGFNKQEVLAAVQTGLADFERALPPGYQMSYTGENKDQAEAFGFLSKALGAGVALILMILIAQFNSVLMPFIIMVAVALSMIGVLLGLLITRTPFGLFTFIGVISLAGIVVNNNIVLIDYMMQLRDRGLSKTDAIVQAGATRLRPVLLTAMTTVLGLIPLTFGINIDFIGLLTNYAPDFRLGSENTQFWGPMGTAIIAGLSFATFLTLVIVPVMYSLLDSTAREATRLFESHPLDEPEG